MARRKENETEKKKGEGIKHAAENARLQTGVALPDSVSAVSTLSGHSADVSCGKRRTVFMLLRVGGGVPGGVTYVSRTLLSTTPSRMIPIPTLLADPSKPMDTVIPVFCSLLCRRSRRRSKLVAHRDTGVCAGGNTRANAVSVLARCQRECEILYNCLAYGFPCQFLLLVFPVHLSIMVSLV